MRIGSGDLSGRKLRAPRGDRTRPTSGRLKKSLFDVLASRIEGARVLDLYAGAGALGIEALSRGAALAVFVERNRAACEAIRKNIEALDLRPRAELMAKDVGASLSKLGRRDARFDLVFADPPYRASDPDKLLLSLGRSGIVAEGGLVAVEHHHKKELHERYGYLVRSRVVKAGESVITLFERAG